MSAFKRRVERILKTDFKLHEIVKDRIDNHMENIVALWGEVCTLHGKLFEQDISLTALEGRVELLEDERDGIADPKEAAASRAVHQKRVIAFRYQNGDLARRWMSPYEIVTYPDGSKAVGGWDHLRDGYRTFRFDRMEDVPTTQTHQDFREPVGF